MQVLNLTREFELQKMKESETIKDYSKRFLSIAKKVRLLGIQFVDSGAWEIWSINNHLDFILWNYQRLLALICGCFQFFVRVIPILNVSRKFSMCIIFSTGYIKIYNIKIFEWIFYTTTHVRTINNTILHVQSINKYILRVHDILQRVRTSSCEISIRLQAC